MARRMNRRSFMRTGIAGAGLLGTGPSAFGGDSMKGPGFLEPGRKIPVAEGCPVIVCGAGPAGIAAALAAARLGATVQLIESAGCLGGIWTAGLLCWVLDTKDKPGILQEILSQLRQRRAGYVNVPGASFAYDAEVMKLLLEELCLEAGVKIQLHTQVVSALTDENKRMSLAVTESKSGRQAWRGKVFIDATGDGDLAARAGCGFDLGRPQDGVTQPMSMMAILTGAEHERIKEFVRDRERRASTPKKRLLAELQKAGVEPSYGQPTLFRIYDNLFCLAANHEYGYVPTDAAQITKATFHARAEIHKLVNALRSLGGVWENLRVVATNEHIGVREGRRIHGLYTVSTDDLVSGARHEDGVCRVHFNVDVHSPKREEGTATGGVGVRAKPYDIPLRALIARDVKGLLLAGRCISGDFIAHSSYRVTGDAVAMGQAAGVAAALAVQNNCLPQDLPWEQIKTSLHRFDTTL